MGTGNIWRYPRIVALHAGGGGWLNMVKSKIILAMPVPYLYG